jgi:hypothetical protein
MVIIVVEIEKNKEILDCLKTTKVLKQPYLCNYFQFSIGL